MKRKGGVVFLTVHLEILLQDRGKLRSLLKPFPESRIMIQDANGKTLGTLQKVCKAQSSSNQRQRKKMEKFER